VYVGKAAPGGTGLNQVGIASVVIMKMDKVLLLNMPFISLSRPAIGISLLKARLAEEGLACDLDYPNLFFADRVGKDAYELISDHLSPAFFAGDWLFSQHLFGDRLDLETYQNSLRQHLKEEERFELLMGMRSAIQPYLDDCLEEFRIHEYRIIGFTTSFEQNMASIALAWTIKKKYPDKIIVFGGANCEGVMGQELHRCFHWIDYVCSGESDDSFPRLVRAILEDKSVEGIGGVVYREAGESKLSGPPEPVHEMDRLPIPDYDDYFEAIRRRKIGSQLSPSLLIETARGCWWGAKSHCTFCGLNGATMTFRSKTAQRVLEELEYLKGRYQLNHFVAVDNIMAHNYFKDLLPLLKQRQLGATFFYEIKSNLNQQQVQLLSEAGVRAIQPGVESLNSHVLKLMRKGVTAIQNIQLLKWCREYGVDLAWNLLYGFPGETPEDYEATVKYMESIYHLKPPSAVSPIRLDRFSPYFNSPDSFGLTNVRPFAIYGYIYPLPPASVANIAYFFEYDYEDGRQTKSYIQETIERAEVWKGNRGGDLIREYGESPELMLTYTRPGRQHLLYPLNGIQREIYDYCQESKTRSSILKMVEARCDQSDEVDKALEAFLDSMIERKLMIREGDQYLSLAVLRPPQKAQIATA
jgi:ribosomal peptide maturation radical SAM protein 1